MSSANSSRESSNEPLHPASPGAENNARKQDTAEPADTSSHRYLKACDNCRRRKVKCDGVRPACGHCTRVDAPCHFSIKPKSRRMWKCLETTSSVPAGSGTAVSGSTASGSTHILTNENKSALDDTTARLLARVETMERLLMQRSGVNPPRTGQAPYVADDYAHQGTLASVPISSSAASHRNSMAGIFSDLDPRASASTASHLQQT
ncbi:hypothetical protein LPJ74_006530, partial [Coemansia sp. RSA 1843]